MRKIYALMISALLISLFIYLFYRTEKTVITELFIFVIKPHHYSSLQSHVISLIPLPDKFIYSLPEGLWVFCITLTSKGLFINVRGRHWDLIFFPLVFAIGLELFQLLHLTNGRFDFWDIGFSVLSWSIGRYLIRVEVLRQNIFRPFTMRSLICISSYSIVYLAHVWE